MVSRKGYWKTNLIEIKVQVLQEWYFSFLSPSLEFMGLEAS